MVRATYLTKDGWFVLDSPRPRARPRRRGTLTDFVDRCIPEHTCREALIPVSLEETLSYVDQAATLSFVAVELLPLLRKLTGEGASSVDPSTEPSRERVREFVARAARLALLFPTGNRSPSLADRLPEWLGAPCAILNGAVFPLERVEGAARADSSSQVSLGGVRYSFRLGRARGFDELCRAFNRTATAAVKKTVLQDDRLKQESAWFLSEVRSLLSRYHPERRSAYTILHRDRYHQVHHSRGSWVLVRGPVRRRTGRGSLFVGLQLRGARREDLFSVTPHAVGSPDAFWNAVGEPIEGGMCMGSERQYRHLYSRRFSNAEAAVRWLDAGVILATGRSTLHRALRESKLSPSDDPLLPELLLREYHRRSRRGR
jgi:hypothetical protein